MIITIDKYKYCYYFKLQIVEFANSLVNARSELQHKYVLKPATSDCFSCFLL